VSSPAQAAKKIKHLTPFACRLASDFFYALHFAFFAPFCSLPRRRLGEGGAISGFSSP